MSRKIATEAAPNWGSFTKAELIRTIKSQDKQKRALLKQVTSASGWEALANAKADELKKQIAEVEPLLELARVKIDELRIQCDDTSLVAEALRKERDALRRELAEAVAGRDAVLTPLLDEARSRVETLTRDCDLLRRERDQLRHDLGRRNLPKTPLLDAADKRFVDAHMPEQVETPSLPFQCDICGSTLHMRAECPDRKRPWD
jgi:hypothetical protein